MKLEDVRGFETLDDYVSYKIAEFSKEDKNFESLFRYMFDENDNVMLETSDGYRIKKVTYGECRARILSFLPTLARELEGVEADSPVGLYCANCPEWIALFWGILACGFKPLLMNLRLPDDVLEGILSEHSVAAVISDGKIFSVKTILKDEAMVPSQEVFPARPFGSEVLFLSSGTTNSVKLCAYTGENFYYQILDSANIIRQCPAIKAHYEGELKQLVLLPLYHVFGFIAVYLWFGFFSRTFVFPKDLNPTTIQNTVKKHKVTHIFAVPMVWEAVCKAATAKIRSKGERTWRKFERMNRLVNRSGSFGDVLAKRFLKEVREGLFGDSICFLISGGSHIQPQTLRFFNGIGYHLANGYGMTEIGITSVETTDTRHILNSASIGAPFGYTEYSVGEKGSLLVRGRTMASRILQNGEERVTDFDAWFDTNDLVREENGRYFILGRRDDLIVGDDGENINPVLAEAELRVNGVDRLCLFADEQHAAVLLVSVPGCFSRAELKRIYGELLDALREVKLESAVRRILFTHENLIRGNEFKISRKKLAAAVAKGELRVFDPKQADAHIEQLHAGLETEIRDCFAEALGRDPETVGVNEQFFGELGGTSIDYFVLLGLIKSRFGVEISSDEGQRLSTVKDFWDYIKKD